MASTRGQGLAALAGMPLKDILFPMSREHDLEFMPELINSVRV
ncbi:MAG: hypothetical protein ABSA57_15325 [Candidatus Acidiferrales bacterium]